jgi:hypothetical protein
MTEKHFNEMDEKLMVLVPGLMIPLRRAGQGSIHFALRWELLLFADEHTIKSLMLVWDHILIHLAHFREYLEGLCLAHVRQVPPPGPHEIVVEKLQTFRDWDVRKLLIDAEVLAGRPVHSFSKMFFFAVAILLVVLIVVFFWRN